MRKAFVILFVAVLALSFCSQGKKQETQTVAERNFHQANKPDEPSRGQPEPLPAALKIKSVTLSPETPTIADDLTVAVEMDDPATEGASLSYQWFVNSRELDDADIEKLDKSRIKKGDWVYCRVRATFEQAESTWVKSDTIRVLNTLPELRMAPVGEVKVPGEFQYRAVASDADEDDLTFELIAPLDKGIALDPTSGLLTWNLTEEAVKALGEKALIKIAVSDGEAKVEGTITLNFTSTTQQK